MSKEKSIYELGLHEAIKRIGMLEKDSIAMQKRIIVLENDLGCIGTDLNIIYKELNIAT